MGRHLAHGPLHASQGRRQGHGLGKNEELLGWLYVGGKPEHKKRGRRKTVDARKLVTRMPKPSPKKAKKK